MFYTNDLAHKPYVYPREYTTDARNENRQLTSDGANQVDVWVTGVPDGVSPRVSETMTKDQSLPMRLYVYADRPLSKEYLETVDSFYGKAKYPILFVEKPCGIDAGSSPRHSNFYITRTGGGASAVDEFLDMRHLMRRHEKATNVFYNCTTGALHRLVLPRHAAQLVLLMPSNFIGTGPKRGYFLFPQLNGLVVRIYSRHFLHATSYAPEDNRVSVICVEDARLMRVIDSLFSRMGLHQMYRHTSSQVIAYDRYITAIVGDTANVYLPG